MDVTYGAVREIVRKSQFRSEDGTELSRGDIFDDRSLVPIHLSLCYQFTNHGRSHGLSQRSDGHQRLLNRPKIKKPSYVVQQWLGIKRTCEHELVGEVVRTKKRCTPVLPLE